MSSLHNTNKSLRFFFSFVFYLIIKKELEKFLSDFGRSVWHCLPQNTVQASPFFHASLYWASGIPRFLRFGGWWQPCIMQAYQHHFSKSICSLCVSVSHFNYSCIILYFLLILYLLCDLWSVIMTSSKPRWSLAFWAIKPVTKVCIFFRPKDVAHLVTEYSRVQT